MSTHGLRDLLARWSRRKAKARKRIAVTDQGERHRPEEARHTTMPGSDTAKAVGLQAPSANVAPATEPVGPQPGAERSGDQGAGRQGPQEPPKELPPVESLTYGSDFTPYLGAEVPEELRRGALRRLWRSDAVLANLDGLNNYDEDYSLFGKVEEAVQTLFRVGRGMVEPERQPVPAQADATGNAAAAAPSDKEVPAGANPPGGELSSPAAPATTPETSTGQADATQGRGTGNEGPERPTS